MIANRLKIIILSDLYCIRYNKTKNKIIIVHVNGRLYQYKKS